MATPGTFPDRAQQDVDIKEEKVATAFEQGHDADLRPEESQTSRDHDYSHADVEKGARSNAVSTHSEEQTLAGDAPEAGTTNEQDRDPYVVDWDGPDDPQNPINWSKGKKWRLIAVLAAVTLVTPLGSSFFAPGVPYVMRDFKESSTTLAEFVVSVYILGFAIGPLIIAPLSELYGRRWIYNISNLFYVIFSVACGVSTSFGMLIAFRFLAGCAGSAPLTMGGGTIADIFPRDQRAGAMAVWAMGPLIGPVLGPVAAGFLVQAKGWRWLFWVVTILGGFFSLLLFFFSHETYHPVLLERKAAKLRKETGDASYRSKLAQDIPVREVFVRAIVRPMKMLFFSPIVFLMSFYVAVNYGILYLFFTTITFVFEGTYHFNSGSVGLSFIGVGVGMVLGLAFLGTRSDKIIKQKQAKGNVKPEHRLPLELTLPGAIGLPIGCFMYGWAADKGVHWIVPIIGTVFIGLGNLTGMMTIQTYLVDAFTVHAASAIAANTVLRSIFGAVLPLAGLTMYDKLGLGWGNSLLGFISLLLVPVPVWFRYRGEKVRTNPKFQVQF